MEHGDFAPPADTWRLPDRGPSSINAVVAGVEIVRTLPALPRGALHKAKTELASRAEHRLSRLSRPLDGWMAKRSLIGPQDMGREES